MDERARARSDGTVNRGGAVFGLVTQRDLVRVIDSDRYPFSSRIRTLGAIRAKLKPEPEGIDAGLAAAKGLRTAIEKQIPGCNRWKLAQSVALLFPPRQPAESGYDGRRVPAYPRRLSETWRIYSPSVGSTSPTKLSGVGC
jgi:hypothetical protein